MSGTVARQGSTQSRGRLLYLAWRWYGISREDAEDLVQAACGAFVEVEYRYPNPDEHPRILVGIYRNICRGYIRRGIQEARNRQRLKQEVEGGSLAPLLRRTSSEDGVLHELVRQENGRLILEALGRARPPAREMFRLITEEGATRADLARHYHVNENTLDSRLHVYRMEVRRDLAGRGLQI